MAALDVEFTIEWRALMKFQFLNRKTAEEIYDISYITWKLPFPLDS